MLRMRTIFKWRLFRPPKSSQIFRSSGPRNCRLTTRIDEPCETNYCSTPMVIGDRLRQLRESKNLGQGDIEKRTGLLRCYISRVENGHTVPSVATLEKL